jgi:hypothetical protein
MIKNPMPAIKISASALRMRRSRARRRGGFRLVQVLLRETEVNALIESGLLEERSRNNPNAVIDAVHRLFDRVFGRMTRNAPST